MRRLLFVSCVKQGVCVSFGEFGRLILIGGVSMRRYAFLISRHVGHPWDAVLPSFCRAHGGLRAHQDGFAFVAYLQSCLSVLFCVDHYVVERCCCDAFELSHGWARECHIVWRPMFAM